MSTLTLEQPDLDLDQVNRRLESVGATQIVQWAAEAFGRGLVMTSSFGVQSAVMLHLATRVVPRIPVILIDTGYLFPQTYQFAEQLRQRLDLNIKVYQSAISAARMEAGWGRLWEQGRDAMDRYDQVRKIEPMQRALKELGATAWLAGLRHDQTRHRTALRIIEKQDNIYKIYPILNWQTQHVDNYLKKHQLPYHPLRDKGYATVGDTHSSRPITPADQDERDTRFRGLKQECGMHLPSTVEEDQSRMGSNL